MTTKLTASLVRQNLENIIKYLHPYSSLANTAMINFIVDDLWLEEVPKSIQSEIKCENDAANAIEFFWSVKEGSAKSIDSRQFINFHNYLNECNVHSLDELHDMWISPDTLKSYVTSDLNGSGLNVIGFMSEKKMHEVDITSDVIANVCSSYSAKGKDPIVVDAGDGKGYLSSHLALKYKLKVLGVDAKSDHTNGAINRMEKLEKAWDYLDRQHKNEQAGIVVEKVGRRKRQKIIKNPNAAQHKTDEPDVDNYKAITHYITKDTDFHQLLNDNFAADDSVHPAICLSGLHTCGNLAPSCLRTFRDSNQIEAICNIGCCYNNLDEQFVHPSDGNRSEKQFRWNEGKLIRIEPSVAASDTTYGFPMSQYLIDKQFALGRNARMLGVQPMGRVVSGRENAHDNLFYRALLEVLIVNTHPQYKNTIHVGRIKRCDGFVDYVRKCSKRMTLFNFDHVTDAEIDDLYRKHFRHRAFLRAFYLLRLCLAPIIEAIILLDRLLYLLEENPDDRSSIHLVKFFDAVVSPRCYGIVGLK